MNRSGIGKPPGPAFGVSGSVSASSTALPTARSIKQKRSQVARACDGCRTHRIKCDTGDPCANCRTAGRKCTNGTTGAPRLSQAHDEVTRLKQRVRQLERELESQRESAVPSQGVPWNQKTIQTCPLERLENKNIEPSSWPGIMLRPPRAPNASWFGPSSLYHFVNRLSDCFSRVLDRAHAADEMVPLSAGIDALLDVRTTGPETRTVQHPDIVTPGNYLNPTQEQYFIDLFWNSYHTCVLPVLDETEFKAHYQSLWLTPNGELRPTGRRPSPIVDIVLAMCMQLVTSGLPSEAQGDISDNIDNTVAGRWYYRRCQALLASEMESPSLSVVQCHLLCAIYLCGGSFHNMVDIACSLALRAAYILGLHREPPAAMSQKEKEKSRRLWWAVYLMETKIGLKLGRPLACDSHAMPQLPGDDFESAMLSGSSFGPMGGKATWLSFNKHHTKLYIVARAAHISFYDDNIALQDGQTIWDNPNMMEKYATVLLHHVKLLENWVHAVPSALTTKRRDGGQFLSIDGSALEVEQFAPLWLQRQRILLELTYHNLGTNMFRPFISFSILPTPGLVAEDHANRCACHAIALTDILHQVLSTTSILDGWHEAFHWQWNAAITLVGFVLVYPQKESTSRAKDAINNAIAVLETFGAYFATAARAADIIRSLGAKVDASRYNTQKATTNVHILPLSGEHHSLMTPVTSASEQSFVSNQVDFLDLYNELDGSLLDNAIGVDFWADLNSFWPDISLLL